MAKPPLPTLKKPSMSVSAMAAFVDAPPAPAVVEPSMPAQHLNLVETEPSNTSPAGSSPAVAEQSADETTSKRPPKKPESNRRIDVRKDGTHVRKVTFHLDAELDKELSILAATEGLDRSVIVEKALERLLRRKS